MEILIILLNLILVFNILFYIPKKLKDLEERQALHFKELNIRLNRLEEKMNELNKDNIK